MRGFWTVAACGFAAAAFIVSSIALIQMRSSDKRTRATLADLQARAEDGQRAAAHLHAMRPTLDAVHAQSVALGWEVVGMYGDRSNHARVRVNIARVQIQRAERQPIVVFGDSLTEAANLPDEICGHPVVNAGIGGATVGVVTLLAPVVLAGARPRAVLFAVGTNDAQRAAPRAAFADVYRAMLSRVAGLKIIATLPPIDPTLPLAQIFRADAIDDFNGSIRSIANEDELPLVDLSAVRGTIDGVHLNAQGYARWIGDIVAGVKRVLACA